MDKGRTPRHLAQNGHKLRSKAHFGEEAMFDRNNILTWLVTYVGVDAPIAAQDLGLNSLCGIADEGRRSLGAGPGHVGRVRRQAPHQTRVALFR